MTDRRSILKKNLWKTRRDQRAGSVTVSLPRGAPPRTHDERKRALSGLRGDRPSVPHLRPPHAARGGPRARRRGAFPKPSTPAPFSCCCVGGRSFVLCFISQQHVRRIQLSSCASFISKRATNAALFLSLSLFATTTTTTTILFSLFSRDYPRSRPAMSGRPRPTSSTAKGTRRRLLAAQWKQIILSTISSLAGKP